MWSYHPFPLLGTCLYLNWTLGGAASAAGLFYEEGPKEIQPWEKNAWNVCEAYVNFTSSGEESVVTMRGRPGKNNAITCCPDAYRPLNTFPQRCSENSSTNKPDQYFLFWVRVFVCIGATVVAIYVVIILNLVPANKLQRWGENCLMGKVELMERVKCMSSFRGVGGGSYGTHGGSGGRLWGSGVWKFERNGKWDFAGNVLHSQRPGKRGGGGGVRLDCVPT